MRDSINDDWGIKQLQNCILNICQYIHEFCEENDIKYCIMGGTALGAIRHGGFIPWDDDIDLFMTPGEYAKFKKIFKEKGDHNQFYLQERGRFNGGVSGAKLRMNNTKFIEEMSKDWDIHQGIFVDIMLLQNYPDNKLSQWWMLFWENYLQIKVAANMHYNRRGLAVKLLLAPFRWLPKRFLLDYGRRQTYKYQSTECKNYFHYYMSRPLSCSIYPKSIFESYDLVDFETVRLRIPTGVKEYLTILFGDYIKVPDIKQIKFNQHTDNWSVNKRFEKNGDGTFADEKFY